MRPHAQHAYVIKVRDKVKADEYDLASQVVGIIKIRVDKADEWLGNGTLLTQSNLFPPPAIDQGYYTLLEYYTELTGNFRIKNYLSEVKPYPIPNGFIADNMCMMTYWKYILRE